MKTEERWKAAFLSSSFPLEVEVAAMLNAQDFAVSTDYAFGTQLGRAARDWSVDIHAATYVPFSQTRVPDAGIELLLECKYRRPGISWLFFQDPNPGGFSPITHGATIRLIDAFSAAKIHAAHTVQLDHAVSSALKVAEIDFDSVASQKVDDYEIRHGLLQLQYAIPRLIREHIVVTMEEFARYKGEALPLFFLPILVTNADLRIVKGRLTPERIIKAKSVDDLGEPVSRCVMSVDPSPEYKQHWVDTLRTLKSVAKSDNVRHLDSRRQHDLGESSIDGAISFAKDLLRGSRRTLMSLASQVLVCHVSAIEETIAELLQIVTDALEHAIYIEDWRDDRFLTVIQDEPLHFPAQLKLKMRENSL